jgi:hypothetical protein
MKLVWLVCPIGNHPFRHLFLWEPFGMQLFRATCIRHMKMYEYMYQQNIAVTPIGTMEHTHSFINFTDKELQSCPMCQKNNSSAD